MERGKRAIIYALLAVMAWSSVAVAFKTGLRYFHYTLFLFLSISVALVIFAGFISLQKKWKLLMQITWRDMLIAMAGGILNPFLYYLVLFKAYSLLPAQMAQSLNYAWPIVLVLLSVPVLGQHLHFKSILSLLVGFTGVYLIASQGHPWPLRPSNPFGVALAIGSSVIWASYWLINKQSSTDQVIGLFINFLTAWFFMLLVIIFIKPGFNSPIAGWLAAMYAGCFEMGFTFIVWLMAMKTARRTDHIANFVFLSPFISMVFIYFILKEAIYYTTVIGLILIVLTIILNQYLLKKDPGGYRG